MAYAKYVVVDPSNKVLYKGNVRLLAWLVWNIKKSRGAKAYDLSTWIIEPASWLICAKPPK